MEFLKDVLGEELYAQVEEKLAGNDKMRIVNAADGSYVPKDKLDRERQTAKDLKSQIDTLNAQISELNQRGADADGIRTQLTKLQADIAAKDAEMKAQSLSYRVKDAVRGSKAKNPEIVLKMIDMGAIHEDGENLLGLTEQLEKMKTDYGYLFEGETARQAGVDPHTNTPDGASADMNAQVNNALRAAAGRN